MWNSIFCLSFETSSYSFSNHLVFYEKEHSFLSWILLLGGVLCVCFSESGREFFFSRIPVSTNYANITRKQGVRGIQSDYFLTHQKKTKKKEKTRPIASSIFIISWTHKHKIFALSCSLIPFLQEGVGGQGKRNSWSYQYASTHPPFAERARALSRYGRHFCHCYLRYIRMMFSLGNQTFWWKFDVGCGI